MKDKVGRRRNRETQRRAQIRKSSLGDEKMEVEMNAGGQSGIGSSGFFSAGVQGARSRRLLVSPSVYKAFCHVNNFSDPRFKLCRAPSLVHDEGRSVPEPSASTAPPSALPAPAPTFMEDVFGAISSSRTSAVPHDTSSRFLSVKTSEHRASAPFSASETGSDFSCVDPMNSANIGDADAMQWVQIHSAGTWLPLCLAGVCSAERGQSLLSGKSLLWQKTQGGWGGVENLLQVALVHRHGRRDRKLLSIWLLCFTDLKFSLRFPPRCQAVDELSPVNKLRRTSRARVRPPVLHRAGKQVAGEVNRL
ncbi:unnamed protein product [Pleuronectes platessa]|uniref:Uncharacterized protein n=1 Tax=Pleuronectes platessa TaxID=8262 RepID=A0A9N7Y2Q1_PLEPL|nr:unnamed protein product [Pleuronectes platessa]